MANLLQTIEEDLKVAWIDVEGFVESEALVVWDAIKVVFTAVLPSQWIIISGLLAELEADIITGNIADIETALLNKAEAQELKWIIDLGSKVLQAIIAVFQAKVASVSVAK